MILGKNRMMNNKFPVNQILSGDMLDIVPCLPKSSVDLVFADPPYNLQLKQGLLRPNMTLVDAVDDKWDQFDSFAHYDEFTRLWLQAVREVMKDNATIWVSGTYHNIFRVGMIMQDLDFWILNTVSWFKPNAMPNFRGTRLKNDVEFVIWAKYSEDSRYTFNHQQMKQFNDSKQLGSMWQIPVCAGSERLRGENGKKLHSTQKPEELLKRIIIASSKPGDVVLDPFSGSGTTAAMAKYLRRQWLGIEREEKYVRAARKRIDDVEAIPETDPLIQKALKGKPKRIPFKTLIQQGHLKAGQNLYLDKPEHEAIVLKDGNIKANGFTGSIHKVGANLKGTLSCNGWMCWLYVDENSDGRQPINNLREEIRAKL